MRVSSISTYVLNNARRNIISEGQSDLMKAGYEMATGQVYDPGLELGRKTGRLMDIENQMSYLEGYSTSNKLLSLRLSSVQVAIQSLIASGDKEATPGALTIFNNMLVGDAGNATPSVAQSVAQNSLGAFISALNTNFNGEYVFGGINTSEPPLKFYKVGGETGPSKIVQETFENFLNGRKLEDLTSEEMEEFIDGPFSDLFNEENFKEFFSNAQGGSIEKHIAPNGDKVDAAVSANEQGFRDAMKNLILVAEFGDIGLSKEAQESLFSRARVSADDTSTSSAVDKIIATASKVGSTEARVKAATQQIETQVGLLKGAKINMIGVDAAEVAQKVKALEAMLEASYTLTDMIRRLSLINYLK
ncbi:flagellar hook-associated family protein [Bartonella sp. AR 15-3]|uniref:flagellar hook-associated family protein n=1 Tax=Bartonella sp. AR 15-3 TaxID=545617 RepID=UPI0001F4CA8E|nr:flagellar hook-associated family protein [Bartonella sp. AR 15-3]OPB31918.1 flagellar hook-associated protein 3 FlgL [Bartonella sp. AR 15-3]CBI79042.1 putative flagellar hook-associated protein 3 (HAP3) [Bartonella sp. AR 15-3]